MLDLSNQPKSASSETLVQRVFDDLDAKGTDKAEEETEETVEKTDDKPPVIGKRESSTKTKPKPAKPKPVANTGPIYLLLQENGKYKELRESELQTEAASVFKDPTLRLVKAQFLIPELSFKLADE